MRRCAFVRRALGPLLLTGTLGGFLPTGASADPYAEALARALRLLPRQPPEVVIVERAAGAGQQHQGARREAFTYRGVRKVYLIRQGPTLQGALKGAKAFECALAAIIWHEMAHLDGADERAAQEAEEQLWTAFIVMRRVDSGVGMRYMALLHNRRQ